MDLALASTLRLPNRGASGEYRSTNYPLTAGLEQQTEGVRRVVAGLFLVGSEMDVPKSFPQGR